MSHLENFGRYFDSNFRLADLAEADAQARSYADIASALELLEPDIDLAMRGGVEDSLVRALGGCTMLVVSAEYVFPLHNPLQPIPERPDVASSRTFVVDLTKGHSIEKMPFRPDLLTAETEWTGVGLVACMAEEEDLPYLGLRRLHDDLRLAPKVAVPLGYNLVSASKIFETEAA